MKNTYRKIILFWFVLVFYLPSFAQTDTLCNPNETVKYFGSAYLVYGGAVNAYTSLNRSDFTLGQILISATDGSSLSQGYQTGFGQWSAWLLPPQAPTAQASQGDFKERVQISWSVNPLSPIPTGFIIYRDGSFLIELGQDARQFLDFNVQAGEYYKYSIVAKNGFGEGPGGDAVGFVNPNGVVSGRIETNSGNPVPGVEVRLTPLTGSSMQFDGVSGQLCVSYANKLPTTAFTVSAYVKFPTGTNTNNAAGIIDWGSGLNKNWWITTTNGSEGKGYIFHIGSGTSSDTLKYIIPVNSTNYLNNDTKWHQITMVYNGAVMSVMVDGNFVGTKPAVIARVKQHLNIGSKNSDGFFKGLIDDVRIYNRPLTQTEVNATKNRSVSKNEDGLLAYWKMDEGVGQKAFDNGSLPANAAIYGNATFSTDIPEVYSSGVSDVTGYYTIDGINYAQVESFRATPSKNIDYNSALEFSTSNKSYGNLTDFDMPDTATVEVLFHPFDLNSRQTILSKGNLYELYLSNSRLYMKLNGRAATDLGIITAQYHHLAVAINNTSGNAKIYLNGILKSDGSFTGISNWANGIPWLVGSNSTAPTGSFYTGLIDEFAIYKNIVPLNQIQVHATSGVPQDSTTSNLFTYFDFNEGIDRNVYDYAAVGSPLKGVRTGTIFNTTWSNNVKNPRTTFHEFQPNVRIVNLNKSNTAVGNIDFKNVSTVNISGYVRFANTVCFADSVQIYSNGQPLFPPVRTDKTGRWSADFEPGANIKLSAIYGDHLISPSFMEFRKLQAPKAGIVFLDNTKRTIRGQVAGGDCRKPIIPTGATVKVKVATTDGCFERIVTISNADGRYVIPNLPARNYTVSIVEHSIGNIYTYFQTKGGQTVDLRNAVADTVDFIYYAPPQLEITGIAANSCGLSTVGQGVKNQIGVRVFQEYFGQKCYVSGPTLRIDDASTGALIDTTLAADISSFTYKFVPQNVNIIPPYRQTITVRATANGSSVSGTTQFIVLGLKSKGKNFTASTPQLPDFILRDPPGDGSYAVLEKGSTICNTRTATIVNNSSQEASLALSVGGTQSIGLGAAIETTNKFTVSASGGASQTWTNSSANTSCVTTTKTITTSPNDIVVGSAAGGDVYVGKSESVTYGSATELNIDFTNCLIYPQDRITIDSIRLNTDFVYSENFIVNSLLPSLLILSKQSTNPKKKTDSVAYVTWKRIIQSNKDDISPTKIKTISFDAGAVYEESENMEETTAWSESFDGAGFIQAGFEAEVDWLGGFTAGATVRYEHVASSAKDKQTTNATTITYHLEDNDPGDGFLINLFKGKKYGTFIFKTVAGQSSCPWEKGTKPRSEPSMLSNDGNSKTNIAKNTSAVFQINLGNLSPTKEQRDYNISLVTGTNPNGAIVKVDGQNLISGVTYTIPYQQQNSILVTIDRGPIAFNYDDIQIQLTASCESDVYNQIPQGGGAYAASLYGGNWADSLFTRYLSLSAHFIEPCSPVDIGFPLQGWVVTPASNNILSITLNEYNKNDPNLKEIRIQYRPIGGDGSWINITTLAKADLGALFTTYQWRTALIQDGDFEIRAVAECTDASKAAGISSVIKGSFQRTPPIVLGVPQPADGTWDPGDEISITFSKPIDCNRVIQADILSNNTIGLYDATTDQLVDATITCLGNKIIIVPNISPKFFENRTFRVRVTGKDYDDAKTLLNPDHQAVGLKDKAGNTMAKTFIWEFYVNQNGLEWLGSDIHEANTVNQLFTVKRQIRNRGGSIMAYRMEGLPSWLIVSPMSGTLNPGQLTDVTLTFQQDLLIGDYLDTLQMVGSQGSEPLLIDYKVRCPSPTFVVDNPAQYEGSMNMVVSLNVFGISSTDPSDIIIAKINGQIRGVGKVAYYRNINKWLALITIYGNSDDIDKNIEFNVWDGSKCNLYADILEKITYQEYTPVGDPITPQLMHVLNLIDKRLPLNKGWNSLSFNLDLDSGNNTVARTLSSLRNKTGALIKDDNSFSKYYGDPINDWKNTLVNIIPQKRYLLYVTDKDTLSLKGSPFVPQNFPIPIVVGWNWIGYIPNAGVSLKQGLKGLTPVNRDIIKSQTLFAQFVAGTGWVGNLSFLEPNKGYLLKISNAGTLTYTDPVSGSYENGFNAPSLATPENPIAFQFSQYQSNMNIIGRVEGLSIDPDDELRAYIDGTLTGLNKSIVNGKNRLFFQTVYHQDALKVSFRLYKADRKKEYELNKTVIFKADSLVGLVDDPLVFGLVTNTNSTVAVNLTDHVIQQPNKIFPTIAVNGGVVPQSANCTTFTFNAILPMGTEPTPPACVAQTGLEGNMVGVMKVKYNERSTFASSTDVLSFINPVNGNVIGCGSFDSNAKVFSYTVKGAASSVETPVDVRYYSSLMRKTFTIKSAFTYKNNKELGDYINPFNLDFSALTVTTNTAGIITAVMSDTAWTGKYCVQVFAMNCSGYNDGQTTVCFQRLKSGDCVDVIVRNNTETTDSMVKAISITSKVQINAGVKMQYKAANAIDLNPGFTTQPSTFFIGQIEGCANK